MLPPEHICSLSAQKKTAIAQLQLGGIVVVACRRKAATVALHELHELGHCLVVIAQLEAPFLRSAVRQFATAPPPSASYGRPS